MNNRKYKTSIITIVGLTVVAGGMFGYQNFYYSKQEAKSQITIYVAKTDIQAKTKVSTDLFSAKLIPMSGVLDSYITQATLKSVIGKELKGGLLTGEPLTKVRVNSKDSNLAENLILKLEPDFVGDIKADDNIRVYVMLTDKNNGETVMKSLFENKKIIQQQTSTEGSLVSIGSVPTDDNKSPLLIKATDAELQAYYKAKLTGKIVISKITDVDTGKISSTDSAKTTSDPLVSDYDEKSEEAKNSYRANDNKDNSIAVAVYTVRAEDTMDTLCKKFKTSSDAIAKLNDNKTVFNAGDKITVPAI